MEHESLAEQYKRGKPTTHREYLVCQLGALSCASTREEAQEGKIQQQRFLEACRRGREEYERKQAEEKARRLNNSGGREKPLELACNF